MEPVPARPLTPAQERIAAILAEPPITPPLTSAERRRLLLAEPPITPPLTSAERRRLLLGKSLPPRPPTPAQKLIRELLDANSNVTAALANSNSVRLLTRAQKNIATVLAKINTPANRNSSALRNTMRNNTNANRNSASALRNRNTMRNKTTANRNSAAA